MLVIFMYVTCVMRGRTLLETLLLFAVGSKTFLIQSSPCFTERQWPFRPPYHVVISHNWQIRQCPWLFSVIGDFPIRYFVKNSVWQRLLCVCNYNDSHMIGTCSMHRRGEKFIQSFNRKTWRKEGSWQVSVYLEV